MTSSPRSSTERRSESGREFLDRIVHRCSDLEGFVWLLWRAGVVRIEDGKTVIDGVDVPGEWSDLIPTVIEEFQQSAMELTLQRARERGVVVSSDDSPFPPRFHLFGAPQRQGRKHA